jgi:MinD superfamily P-loop ATPase
MKIAIASGKGGTGKTTVSAGLADIWPKPVLAMDLDVEAPNLRLFLKPGFTGSETATMAVPEVDESRCTYCRACAEHCQFKAISVLGLVVLTFPEMCHGCGGCWDICPEGAITPGSRELGEIRWGKFNNGDFLEGKLRIGEAMSPPLMRLVKAKASAQFQSACGDTIIDAPPGVSCPAVNAAMDNDVIILVTEPTPFGAYDLQLAHEAFTALEIPMGVVVNRAGLGDRTVYDYCRRKDLPILAEIPNERRLAETYARGGLVTSVSDEIKAIFHNLSQKAVSLVKAPAVLKVG